MLPKDPVMLLSFINLKLRDYDYDLEALCDDLDVAQAELIEKLSGIDYHYDREKNQFV
jgi:hypothetical protein